MIATPDLITLLSAELIFLLVRSSDILIALESAQQRSEEEQYRIDRGLVRSIVIEAFAFVPSSAALIILLAPLLLPEKIAGLPQNAVQAALGVVSYGFPFATLRRIVTVVALNTLSEFANLAPPKAEGSTKRRGEKQT